MPYFAAVFTLVADAWSGDEAELDITSLDDVADLMRDSSAGDPTLLLIEQDDEWFAVLRQDGDDDPRVFISDLRATADSTLARALTDDPDGTEPDESPPLHVQPSGDAGLLTDLGLPAGELQALATGEGLLPADGLLRIAERLGFGDELDRMR